MAVYLVCMSFRPDLGVPLLDMAELVYLARMSCRQNPSADLLDILVEVLLDSHICHPLIPLVVRMSVVVDYLGYTYRLN